MRNSRKKILILLVFCLGIRVVRAQAAEPLDECSVSSQSVQSAPCKMQRPLTEVEIEHSIHALIPTGDFIISKELFGLHIQNESHYLIRLLETLLTPITPGLAPHVFQSSCTDVMCLVNEPGIFGPRVGPKILWMLGRYGMNGSQYAYANSDQWTDREIDILLLALGDLPSSIFPLQTNRQLTHFKRGNQSTPTFSIPGHEMQKIADAGIFFYDLWDNEDPNLQRAALVHELGHALSDQYQNLSESQTWKNFSGWTLSNNRWALAAPERTVSLYAQVNPNEDFAESVAAYRYNPKSLQVRSPEKYAFIKDTVFDGLEYTSTEACDPSHAFSTVL